MFIGYGDPGRRPGGAQPAQQEEAIEQGWTERDLVKGVTHLYSVMNRVEEQAEKDNALPCKSGCSWCCENVTVLLSQAEWTVIVRYLTAADPKVVRKILRKSLLMHQKNKETVEQITADQEKAEELAASIKAPCPMLENKMCAVYEARPHDCRMYGCSFKEGELYACHLVLDAVVGKEVTLPAYEASAQMLTLYPRTDVRQTFAYWAKHHLPDALRDLALGDPPPG